MAASPGADETSAALSVLCRRLRADAWSAIRLQPLDGDSGWPGLLASALRHAGWSVWPYFCFGSWYLPATGLTGESYLRLLPKKQRHTLRRMPERIEASCRREDRLYRDDDGLEQGIADYVEIYDASWRHPEQFPDFMPSLIRTAAAEGWLRLLIVRLDGEPAAAQLWFVWNRKAYIYKIAYKEKFSEYSIGSVATFAMMARVLDEEDVDEVDYLSGDDDYKRTWMSDRREYQGLSAYNRATLKGLGGDLYVRLKSVVKRMRPRTPAPELKSRLKRPS